MYSEIAEDRKTSTIPQGSSGDWTAHIWDLFQSEARELWCLFPACISHCLTATPRPGGDINSQDLCYFKSRQNGSGIWGQPANGETQVLVVVRAHWELVHIKMIKVIEIVLVEKAFATTCIFGWKGQIELQETCV